ESDKTPGRMKSSSRERKAPPSRSRTNSERRADASHNGSEPIPVMHAPEASVSPPPLEIDPELTKQWLVSFLREEFERRGFENAVLGLSGGVDSAVTTFLAAEALGPKNVIAIRMPYRTSNPDSLRHAQLV